MPDDRATQGTTFSAVSLRAAMVVILIAWIALAAIRLTAPSDLLDNDQVRPAMYALDVLRNGNWIIQTDPTGDVASKPPLYVWLVAVVSLISGRVDVWSLYLPTAGAMLAITLLVLHAAGKRFGASAGLLGAAAFLFSPFAAKHLALARTDAVFALAVSVAAMLAYCAWSDHRPARWTLFWLACAAATLTKGPLGVVLAACGLVAVMWDRPRGAVAPKPRVALIDHACGVLFFIAICGGWFLAAYSQLGQPIIDRMIGRELVGHAAASDGGGLPFISFYKPPLYFLSRFAPWCVPACIGLWRVFKHPSQSADERRFERFLASWFLVGLALFCAAPHQRADLLLPLIPAAAMLAGRELARWLSAFHRLRPLPVFFAIAVIGTVGVTIDRHFLKRRDPVIQQTAAWRDLARRIDAIPGGRPPIIDVEAPMGLQMFLQVHQRRATMEHALESVRRAPTVLIASRLAEGEADNSFGRVLASLTDPARREPARIIISTNDPTLVLPP